MASPNAPPIASFVFIDLETTSLPQLEHNRTKITEVSFVSVKRRHLLDCRSGETPRVLQKVTLCVSPRRLIDPGCTLTTGLSNDLLEHESHFSEEVYNTLNSFLSTLEKPACLLAHNGLTFDFPILRASLERVGKKFLDNLLCADTLHAYVDIFQTNVSNICEMDPLLLEQELNIDFQITNRLEEDIYVELEEMLLLEEEFNVDFEDQLTAADEQLKVDSQSQNETTPTKVKTLIIPKTPKKKQSDLKGKQNLNRRLTYSEMKGKRLCNVYKRLLGKPAVGCHRAEVDCLLNLEASVAVADQFVRWVDRNHCFFNNIEPMRLGVPLTNRLTFI